MSDTASIHADYYYYYNLQRLNFITLFRDMVICILKIKTIIVLSLLQKKNIFVYEKCSKLILEEADNFSGMA